MSIFSSFTFWKGQNLASSTTTASSVCVLKCWSTRQICQWRREYRGAQRFSRKKAAWQTPADLVLYWAVSMSLTAAVASHQQLWRIDAKLYCQRLAIFAYIATSIVAPFTAPALVLLFTALCKTFCVFSFVLPTFFFFFSFSVCSLVQRWWRFAVFSKCSGRMCQRCDHCCRTAYSAFSSSLMLSLHDFNPFTCIAADDDDHSTVDQHPSTKWVCTQVAQSISISQLTNEEIMQLSPLMATNWFDVCERTASSYLCPSYLEARISIYWKKRRWRFSVCLMILDYGERDLRVETPDKSREFHTSAHSCCLFRVRCLVQWNSSSLIELIKWAGAAAIARDG